MDTHAFSGIQARRAARLRRSSSKIIFKFITSLGATASPIALKVPCEADCTGRTGLRNRLNFQ